MSSDIIPPVVRNTLIDSIRGFAIIIMIAANSWPYLAPSNYCPMGLRILFSVAAPLFIFLSGVSLYLAEEAGKSAKQILIRVIQILVVAIIIDALVWQILPFYTFDVLYLIAFSLALIVSIRSFSLSYQLIIVTALFFLNLLLLKYHQFEMSTLSVFAIKQLSIITAIKQAVISGWFPILPWAGVAITGYLIAKYRKFLKRFKSYCYLLGIASIVTSVFILLTQESTNIQAFRIGYTELFYPVKGIFYLLLLGLYCLLIPLVSTTWKQQNLLSSIGRKSLFIYFVHIVIIKYFFFPYIQDPSSFQWWIFTVQLLIFYLLIIVINYLIEARQTDLKYGKYKRIGFVTGL
ncbi:heparan-alpha-glucosaminide N-acetyltransferase domain-containing protein [Carboxylicivirga sp. M1479]|uniref:heparan-alpha-glucosaminide N-acetyltransferase domain-containing protein n=1 Tax=Carboxylicivirga sp. M1479 TaxID=2594476 RepID=UPI001177CEDF|nr:heparan-alpha-glucosaminide N-acetyltransferase domain-containing protein [Carboxylicivirga sp. M1479]TRX66166.1 DUF1624 domain-containing protein [Carboxylicivirga sp. M1479]